VPATDAAPDLGLRDYLAIVWRHRWMVLAVVVVATAASVALSMTQSPRYRASAEVLVRQPPTATSLGNAGVVLSPRALENELQTARGSALQRQVRDVVGQEPDLEVRATDESDVFSFRAESSDAERAAEAANAYSLAYILHQSADLVSDYEARAEIVEGRIDEVEDQLEAGEGDATALEAQKDDYERELEDLRVSMELARTSGSQVIDAAGVPGTPFSPTPVRNGIFACLLGLLIGVGLSLLRENLDVTLRTPEDLTGIVGGPALAVIPTIAGWRDEDSVQVVTRDRPHAPAAEAYRGLRTTVQFLGLDDPLRTVQLTSARPGDGKTTTAVNLAVVSARAGQRVVLVDCDLRKPRIHKFFGLDNKLGFTSLLLGEANGDVANPIEGEPNLVVITSGPIPPDPSELLSSPRARQTLARLSSAADLVLVDSPPVLAVSDPLVISGLVDGVVLVAAAGSTDTRQVGRAVEQLRQVDAPLLGAVLNRFNPTKAAGYGHYSYSYRPYAPAPASAAEAPAPEPSPAVDEGV
jgi:succinoglycan biosynthesis transport protein ExoP